MSEKNLVVLILFGAAAVLCAVGQTRWGLTCIAAGLFVGAL